METDLPTVERLVGAAPGPRLALLGGVHGDELEGVLAVRTVVDRLSAMPFSGSVVWAAPAHPAAWAADSRLSPSDGRNLARVFPGGYTGSPTDRVAAHLTAGVIAGADLLIDLHSAGRGFDMPLLVGYHSAGHLAGRAEAAARAFNAPLLWQHPAIAAGRSLSAAEEMGVPSIYVEGRGGGRLRQWDLDAYVNGVLRAMTQVGMLDGDRAGTPAVGPQIIVRGDGNTDEGITAPVSGYFVSTTTVGDHLPAGDRVGVMIDHDGRELAVIAAPTDGVVMLLRRGARVHAGDTLAIVAEVVGSDAGSAASGEAGAR